MMGCVASKSVSRSASPSPHPRPADDRRWQWRVPPYFIPLVFRRALIHCITLSIRLINKSTALNPQQTSYLYARAPHTGHLHKHRTHLMHLYAGSVEDALLP